MLKFLASMFSGDSCASFSRAATAVTVFTGCGCLVYVVRHTHTLPDATALIGLGTWMTMPYAINKATAMFSKPGSGNSSGGSSSGT